MQAQLLSNLAAADAVCALERESPRRRATEMAYARMWERWEQGERWEGAPSSTRTFVLAGVRWGAMRALRAERERLRSALASGVEGEAQEAAGEVGRLIATLTAIPRDRPGRRARPPGVAA